MIVIAHDLSDHSEGSAEHVQVLSSYFTTSKMLRQFFLWSWVGFLPFTFSGEAIKYILHLCKTHIELHTMSKKQLTQVMQKVFTA